MIIKSITKSGYIFERETGETIELTFSEVRNLQTLLNLERLKSVVHYAVRDADGDTISLGSLADITADEFEEEVYSQLEDIVLYGDSGADFPTEQYINEVILDTARDYCIEYDE